MMPIMVKENQAYQDVIAKLWQVYSRLTRALQSSNRPNKASELQTEKEENSGDFPLLI